MVVACIDDAVVSRVWVPSYVTQGVCCCLLSASIASSLSLLLSFSLFFSSSSSVEVVS